MLRLYSKFPRQIGIGGFRKTVTDLDEMLEHINRYIRGYKRIFVSVYDYTPESKDTTQVDKIFLDFDNKETCIVDVNHMHHWLSDNNYKHIVFFSGGGFHIYVLAKNYQQFDKKESSLKAALKAAQKYLCKSAGLKIGDQVDEHIIGNIAQLATVPNTWNTKRRRYCISVSERDLELGYEHIKDKAIHRRFKYYWYGHKIFDIGEFKDAVAEEIELPELTDREIEIVVDDDLLSKMPQCVQKLLLSDHLGWRGRFLAIVYLREAGYMKSEVFQILEKYLKEKEFKHCIREERQLDYLFAPSSRRRVFFPDCKDLRSEGRCPISKQCKLGKELYL